jgi:hypothetical protein
MELRAEQPISLVNCTTLLTAVGNGKVPVPSVLARIAGSIVASQIDLRQKIKT